MTTRKQAARQGAGLHTARGIKNWLAWMAPPCLLLLALALAIEWLTHGHPDRTTYWSSQLDWFLGMNSALSAVPHAVWRTLSLLGESTILLPLLFVIVIPRPRILVSLMVATPLATALSLGAKELAAVPRPAAVLDHASFTIIGGALIGRSSLPSGHAVVVTTAAIAILAVLVPAPQTWRQWALLLAGLSMAATGCVARIASGAHWPMDLLAGTAIGWIAGLSGAAVARRCNWGWQRTGSRRVVGALLLLGSLAMMMQAMGPDHHWVRWASVLCGSLAALWLLITKPAGKPARQALRQ